MSLTITLDCLEQTERFGKFLGKAARPGDIYTLSGDLGAGKTTLTQYIGAGLGVPADCYITSPTFSLMHEYPGHLPMYHMDLYRLSPEEIHELGFEDYIYGEGLSVIEWPDRLGALTPKDRLDIVIDFTSEFSRTFHLLPSGNFCEREFSFDTLKD